MVGRFDVVHDFFLKKPHVPKRYTLRESNIAMEFGTGLKMYFLLKTRIFHCYVSLPEGTPPKTNDFPLKNSGWKSTFLLQWPFLREIR